MPTALRTVVARLLAASPNSPLDLAKRWRGRPIHPGGLVMSARSNPRTRNVSTMPTTTLRALCAMAMLILQVLPAPTALASATGADVAFVPDTYNPTDTPLFLDLVVENTRTPTPLLPLDPLNWIRCIYIEAPEEFDLAAAQPSVPEGWAIDMTRTSTGTATGPDQLAIGTTDPTKAIEPGAELEVPIKLAGFFDTTPVDGQSNEWTVRLGFGLPSTLTIPCSDYASVFSTSVRADTTPPTFAVSALPNPAKAGTVTLDVDASEPIDAANDLAVSVNDQPATCMQVSDTLRYACAYTIPATGAPQGPAKVEISGVDLAGNPGTLLLEGDDSPLLIDTFEPTSSSDLVDGTQFNEPFDITFEASDPDEEGLASGVDHVAYRIDDGAIQQLAPDALLLTVDIADGEHALSWFAVDRAGNAEEAHTVGFIVDTTLPVFSDFEAQPALAKAGPVTIRFTTSEDLAEGAPPAVTVNANPASLASLDGTTYSYTYTVTAADLQGPATIAVSGTDLAGNVGTGSDDAALAIDTVAPTASDLQAWPALAQAGPVTLTFTASEPLSATPVVQVNGNTADFVGAEGDAYNYFYTVPAEGEPQGPATIAVSLVDAAGNQGSLTDSGALVVDTAEPIFEDPRVSPLFAKAGPVTITFNVSEPLSSDPLVEVRDRDARFVSLEDGQYTFSFVVLAEDEQGSASIDVTGLDPAGNHGSASWPDAFFIDTGSPLSTLDVLPEQPDGHDGWYVSAVSLNLSCEDASDECAAIRYRFDAGQWQEAREPFGLPSDGAHALEYAAVDRAGNMETPRGPFTLKQDLSAPAFGTVEDIVAEAQGDEGATVEYDPPVVTEAVSTASVTCTPAPGLLPLGETTVECSAIDEAGNEAQTSFTVTVQDTTPPTLELPGDVVQEATSPDGAEVHADVIAFDLVSVPEIECENYFDAYPLGTTLVSCVAIDAAGNRAEGTFNVTVQDTTPPTLDLPESVVAEATGPGGAIVDYLASASDAVGVAIACDPFPGDLYPLGKTSVACVASDTTGNEARGAFNVTVRDTTPPTLAQPSPVTFTTDGDGANVNYPIPAATDAASTPTVTCAPASGTFFHVGTTLVTCTATDGAGLTAKATFNVTGSRNSASPPPPPPPPPPPADTTAPASELKPVTPFWAAQPVLTLAYVASDNVGVASVDLVVSRSTDGKTWTAPAVATTRTTSPFTYTLTDEGYYRFHTIAHDGSGNAEAAPAVPDVAIGFDRTSPVVRIDTPAEGSTVTTVSLAAAVDEARLQTVIVRLDGTPVAATIVGGAVTAELGPVDDGPHTIDIVASDLAGNEGHASRSFTVTSPPPTIEILGVPAELTTPAELRLRITGLSPTTTTLLLDGEQIEETLASDTTRPLDPASLAAGEHVLQATVRDAKGRTATATTSFTVPPSAARPSLALDLPAEGALGPGETVSGHADGDAASVELVVDGVVVAQAPAGAFNFSMPTLRPGNHTASIILRDDSGKVVGSRDLLLANDETPIEKTSVDEPQEGAAGRGGAVATPRGPVSAFVIGGILAVAVVVGGVLVFRARKP